MMSTEGSFLPLNTEHITIILVRPQTPGNIGSVARAMRNMGLHRLALVQPARFPHPEARMMACNAEALLQQAQVYDSLSAAVATCHWLIGTSARRRQYRNPPLTPRTLAEKLPDLCQHHHVGLLFGPEDAGLTTPELNQKATRPLAAGMRVDKVVGLLDGFKPKTIKEAIADWTANPGDSVPLGQ